MKGVLDPNDVVPETNPNNNERLEVSCFSVATAPDITLNPSSLTFDMNNDVRTQSVTLTNTGSAVLEWEKDSQKSKTDYRFYLEPEAWNDYLD